MKIAIHHRFGSFSDNWIAYCKKNAINYKIVDAFDSDIIHQVKDCDAFMWHHHHAHFRDTLTAKRILFALEQAGVKVFPDFNTSWHFDDKVAQKYLLEAINAPLVPSYVFYDKKDALKWAERTSYPKVFKLKGGAGATNVKLIKDYNTARRLINRAFGNGFQQYNKVDNLKERIHKFKQNQASILDVGKSFGRILIAPEFSRRQSPEKGYVYFQEFIPNNKTDFRIKVVDNKAWGFQRVVRNNDFRASGSGELIFDNKLIPQAMIKTALNVASKLGTQSIAFDFIIDEDNNPLIVEISYGFGIDEGEFNLGYWDKELNWHGEEFNPQEWMVKAVIDSLI